MKGRRLRAAAGTLAAALMLSGCAESAVAGSLEALTGMMPEVQAGATISEDSKWINSDIAGAVDETVAVNLKDDFHTAVNYDWILNTELPEEKLAYVGIFSQAEDALQEQNYQLMKRDNTAVDEDLMSQEDYDHLQELTAGLADLLMDWDTRNEQGVEPIRSYAEELAGIQSLEELSSYLVSGEGWSSFGNLLLTLEMYTPYNSREQYSVYIMPFSEWSLSGQKSYTKYNSSDVKLRSYNESAAEYVLGELGYSESEIQRMLKENYQVEQKLAAGCIDDSKVTDTAKEVDETLTLEDLEQMQGDYPLTQILEAQGLDGSDLFSVYQKDYLNTLAGVYTEENLEALRSFYLVHLVLETLPYLDQKSYGISEQRRAVTENVKEQKETETEEEKTNQAQQMAYRIENDLFPDLLDELYAARYCKAEDKAALMELTQEMVSFYRQMLQEEDWLSEETRQKAVEKLDAMTLRVLYPDVLKDYSGLNYDSNGTIVDAVNDIQEFSLAERKNDVNQPIRKSDWPISTRTANAGYVQEENSINICAGLMADGQVYNRDASEEFNLGRVGMVIGHEITHAFDTNGYQYDKDGLKNNWWSKEDEEAMRQRADKVNKYYHSFTPVAGETYSANVASEAIADMGGVKCVLGIAKERENFNYEEFFRSYAGLWKTKDNYSAELLMSEDTHPLAFLRTNITLQQFDEFLETFDIQEGDGMYLSPEERITVW